MGDREGLSHSAVCFLISKLGSLKSREVGVYLSLADSWELQRDLRRVRGDGIILLIT